MSKIYNVPTPDFEPTESDREWVKQNIVPRLTPALNIIKGAFDRVDLPQTVFADWPQRAAVEQHFADLGLKIRRFAGFIGHKNQCPLNAHIDAFVRGTPMVARFNIPYFGCSPTQLEWWDDGVDSDKIEERAFTELRNGREHTAYSYKSTIVDWGTDSVYKVINPGAGWNRTEIAHRMQAPDCNENRIIITTEIAEQIPWAELVARLASLGYH
jgi:hypothetical protein